MFSAPSKTDNSVKLNFSLDVEALGEDDLINSSPSHGSDSNLFQTGQLLRQMEPVVTSVEVPTDLEVARWIREEKERH
jgi:hypothetical protein